MKDTIKKLVETYGPSGHEEQIRDVIRAEIAGLADEIKVDPLGNLIALRHPRGSAEGGRRIMLAAHMDEIGVMVTFVDEKGFARYTNLGGVGALTQMGGRVRFADGTLGVIGLERRDRDQGNIPSLDQFFIDTGAGSREACKLKVGDSAGFSRPFEENGNRLIAKSMDDRIGCAVLIESLHRLGDSAHELAFVFSVQEEVGTRGAQTSAFGLDPEIGLAVDVTGVGDTPRGRMAVSLGAGPAVKVRDAGMLAHPAVKNWMADTAEAEKIPYQLEVLEGGSTDARAIQLARGGVAAGCLSIPCRYIHSPSEMVDYDDVQNSVKLLVAMLSKPVNLEQA